MSGLLKFITCGSVDDGKSTLIGHILYDAKLLYADQERALELDSKVGSRGGAVDYSLLLDGLMAEREQGITIDVAYRYFTTDRRSFIVADTPGHEEYTRNMAVGASFAQLAVILIDATQGVLVQTCRHARICALMGIRHFVFAVNKMDLADYSEEVFRKIEGQIGELTVKLGLRNVKIIPLSATEGDNVTKESDRIPWYRGGALLPYLETVEVDEYKEEGFYMPIQRVSRPDHTFRGFQGEIEAGTIAVDDTVTSLPSGEQAHVKRIYMASREVKEAVKGQPVSIQLDREMDVSRGCVFVKGSSLPVTNQMEARILWMDDEPLAGNREFFIQIGTKQILGVVQRIRYTIDVNTGAHDPADTLHKNEIAVCDIALAEQVVLDLFSQHKTLGELLIINRVSNATSACGVIEKVEAIRPRKLRLVTPAMRAAQKQQTPFVVRTASVEAAKKLEQELFLYNRHTMVLEKKENVVEAAKLLHDAGLITLIPGGLLTVNAFDELISLIPENHFVDMLHETILGELLK